MYVNLFKTGASSKEPSRLPRPCRRATVVTFTAALGCFALSLIGLSIGWYSEPLPLPAGGAVAAEQDEAASQRAPLPASEAATSLHVCVLNSDCRVGHNHHQLRVEADRLVPSKAATSLVQIMTAHTSALPLHLLFVVEDGCAMGHLMKDVGVVLELVAVIQRWRSNSTTVELHLVFGNRCADASAWAAAPHLSQRASSASKASQLFAALLAPWWHAVVDCALQQTVGGVPLLTSIHVLFADEFSRWESESRDVIAQQRVVVIRRPVQWRWFYQPAHATLLREFVLRRIGFRQSNRLVGADPKKLSITVIERHKNRRFQEHRAADTARSVVAAWGNHAEVQVVDPEKMSFEDQVVLFAHTDILIAAHGAALALTMFMDPSTAMVVELFPYNFGYWLYEELAMSIGLGYRLVRGKRPSLQCAKKPPCALHPPNSTITSHHDLYVTLRQWNGHSQCKNCDVMWCEGTTEMEAACLEATLVPLLRDACRSVAVKRIRQGKSIGVVNTTRWLDRRS